MINLNKRISLISKIVMQKPSLGKTAMMKSIYILQQVYKVPLGYDYQIYTYGPYSSEVMEDIEFAVVFDAIRMETIQYPSHYLGYQLKPTEKTEVVIQKELDFLDVYDHSISEVMDEFGDKTAKELELSSTIIYIYNNSYQNGWSSSKDYVSERVQKIKPHFSMEQIQAEYDKLEKSGILERSISS